MTLFSLATFLALPPTARAASSAQTQAFLRDHRHAWLPYPFPGETSTNELATLLQYNFDVVGISFAGSYHGGKIDFSELDTAIGLIAAKGKTAALNLTPRFDETDGVFDRLSDGSVVTNVPYKNPNASMIDVFDPRQRAKFCDWIELCVRRYGLDPRVSGFVLGWGYMGETGFFMGDYLSDFRRVGSVASGYSQYALKEFNAWRAGKKLSPLAALPLPSLGAPNRDYILFHQFRTEFAGNIFQKEAVDRAQSFTDKPVGTFGYISVNIGNYARDWAFTPNADFFRSAVSTASFDLTRTLLDSGVGYEDHELSDGPWNLWVKRLERDLARQIAHGGVFHAMPVRVYENEPGWQPNFFPRLADFLLRQNIAKSIKPEPAEIAVFQPTWSAAALPGRSATNPFVPTVKAQNNCSKMVGLVESFGLPYKLITERELLDPKQLESYRHIIIPLWDYMPEILDDRLYTGWSRDPRVIPIRFDELPVARSHFRDLLKQNKIAPRFDYNSDRILAGRVNNMIFNWDDKTITVTIPAHGWKTDLRPMEFRLLPEEKLTTDGHR